MLCESRLLNSSVRQLCICQKATAWCATLLETLLTCCTMIVFKSTERSMKLKRDAILPSYTARWYSQGYRFQAAFGICSCFIDSREYLLLTLVPRR